MKNYYDILEVSKSADQDTIKQAYRTLSKKFHPDKNPDGEAKFKEVSEAYDTLGDVTKRATYDNPPRQSYSNFSGFNTTFTDFSFAHTNLTNLNIQIDRNFKIAELMAGVEFTVNYKISKSNSAGSTFEDKSIRIKLNLSTQAYPFTQVGADNAIILKVRGGGSSQVTNGSDFFGRPIQSNVNGDLIIRVIIDLQGLSIEESDLVQPIEISLYESLFNDELVLENPLGKKYRIKSFNSNNLSDLKVRIPGHGLFAPSGATGSYVFDIKIKKIDLSKLSESALANFKELLSEFDK